MNSFDEEFDRLWAIAYRVAYRILGRREEAEDVAQDALGRVAFRWGQVADYAAPFTARVAGQRAIDVWRKRPPVPTSTPALAASGAGGGPGEPDRPASETSFIERDRLVAALRTLSTRQRQAILLRYIGDFDERDTARAMGCSAGTVKQHTSRGLRTLRLALGDLEDPT